MRAGVLAAAERRACIRQSLGSRRVTSLVWVPRLLAVITEQSATAGPLTRQLRTTRTARRYHDIPAATTMFVIGKNSYKTNSQRLHDSQVSQH